MVRIEVRSAHGDSHLGHVSRPKLTSLGEPQAGNLLALASSEVNYAAAGSAGALRRRFLVSAGAAKRMRACSPFSFSR